MRRKIGRHVNEPLASESPTGNSFLDALPASTKSHLWPLLFRRALKRGVILAQPGNAFPNVYFPIRSVISTLTRMNDGASIEVGFAGNDGFSPVVAGFGSRRTPHEVIVQIADSSYGIDTGAFVQEIGRDADLRSRLLAYAEYSFIAASQFAACNRLHPVAERYARWILMAQDRAGEGEFILTQDFAAEMLGVRRAGVTVVASAMSNAGLIAYRRSHIRVLNRLGLEDAACECYRAVNDELLRLMGYTARRPGVREIADEGVRSPLTLAR